MTTRCLRLFLRSAVLALLTMQVACVASRAAGVQCDSNLRPINPTNADKP